MSAQFYYTMTHVPGTTGESTVSTLQEELVEISIVSYITHFPASPDHRQEYREARNSDLLSLIKYFCTGWPGKEKVNVPPTGEAQGSLTMIDDLLLYNHLS